MTLPTRALSTAATRMIMKLMSSPVTTGARSTRLDGSTLWLSR